MASAGDRIKAGDVFGLTSWTPNWSGGVNTGLGATNEGWYQMLGDVVMFGFRLQFGSSSSTTGSVILDLPVAAWTGGGNGLQMAVGSFIFRDQSAGTHYAGTMGLFTSGGTSVSFAGMWNGTAPNGRLSNTVPLVAALDDIISGSGVYKAA